jgi:hypothetical protein
VSGAETDRTGGVRSFALGMRLRNRGTAALQNYRRSHAACAWCCVSAPVRGGAECPECLHSGSFAHRPGLCGKRASLGAPCIAVSPRKLCLAGCLFRLPVRCGGRPHARSSDLHEWRAAHARAVFVDVDWCGGCKCGCCCLEQSQAPFITPALQAIFMTVPTLSARLLSACFFCPMLMGNRLRALQETLAIFV